VTTTPAVEDLRRIADALRAGVALADASGAVLYANKAFTAAVFTQSDRARLTQAITRVSEGKAASSVIDAKLDDGRFVQVTLTPASEHRKPAEVVLFVQDIGALREAEGEMNLAAARMLALAEATPTAVMIENARGEIEIANDAFCRLLGIESAPQSLTGVRVADTLAKSKKGAKALDRQPLVVDDAPAGAIHVGRKGAGDASDGHKVVAEIALIEKIAMELSVAMEGLSAIAIRAQQMEVDPQMVQAFQRIRKSTETAMAAMGDLVDFSKMSGGVVLHKAEFALRESLAELVARLIPDAEEHRCRLRLKIEQDVANWLEGDVERLQLVVKNLLDTAFALFPGSEVALAITPEYVTESGIQLSFTVSSSGAGQSGAKVNADGGMGVAVAKFMVTAMGGKVAVASRASGETLYSFTLEFPLRPAPPPPQRATFVSLVGLPVMVVSSDIEQRDALSNRLRGWRMTPLEADNAPMAMALLERMAQEGAAIPLVIVSNELPVQDGFLLAFRIKNHPKFRATLVMMLATNGKPGDAIACRENGISAYMRYPVNDGQLNDAILAVTGASIEAEDSPTLVTRHSLREQRKGATVLLVDAQRDAQILAAHALGKLDASLVLAQDLAEALAALDQDVYDLVLVDTTLEGLSGNDAANLLRARIARNPEAARLVATSTQHSKEFNAAKTAIGFNATLAKPFRRETLGELLRPRATAEAG
jgi:CheY-like chemotaxis protein